MQISAGLLGADALLLATALIWGLAFVAQRVGMDHVGPFAFNAARYLLGALSLLPLLFIRRRAAASHGCLPPLIAGLCLFAGASLQQVGLVTTTAGNAAFVTSLYVVLVPLIGALFGRRVGLRASLASLVAVVGLYFITIRAGFIISPGDLLELGGAFFWALHILVIGRFASSYDPIRLSIGQFLVAGLLSLAISLAIEPVSFDDMGKALVPILYGGIGSCGVAFTLQIIAQRSAKPSHASIILALEGLFGALGGIILIGEPATPCLALGGTLMVGAAVLSQLEPRTDPTLSAKASRFPARD